MRQLLGKILFTIVCLVMVLTHSKVNVGYASCSHVLCTGHRHDR